MQSATLTNRNLKIDGMNGDGCVKKVTSALKNCSGVTTESVEVGSATIEADQNGCDAACKAIGNAGYKAREENRSGKENDSMRASAKNPSGHNGGSAGGANMESAGNGAKSQTGDQYGRQSGDKAGRDTEDRSERQSGRQPEHKHEREQDIADNRAAKPTK